MDLPFYKQLLVAIVIVCAQYCDAQRGEFYGLINGVVGGTALNIGDDATITLNKFKYFGKQDETTLKIYTHGVIGIGDIDLSRGAQRECPPLAVGISALTFIAPYWLPVTSGEVKYMVKENNNDLEFTRMAGEIDVLFKKVDGSNIMPGDIERAVIVTWEKMQNVNNQPRTQIDNNSFQTVIVFLKQQNGEDFNRAYALFVYRVLNYQLVRDNINNAANTPACNSRTYIGLGDVDPFFLFRITRFFPFRRARVAVHSNINNFNLLGRYAFDLSLNQLLQPFPPVLNCAHPDPDEKVCGVITTNGQPAQSGKRRRRAVAEWSLWNNGSNDTKTTSRTRTTVAEWSLWNNGSNETRTTPRTRTTVGEWSLWNNGSNETRTTPRTRTTVAEWSLWNNGSNETRTTPRTRTTVTESTKQFEQTRSTETTNNIPDRITTPSIPPLNTTPTPDQTTPANNMTTPKPTDNPIVIESMTMRAAKEFCLFRKAGQYDHPIFCNLFMYCGVGGSRADVKKCPDRLNYNTVLGVCDWKENLECNFPPKAIVIASSGSTISPKPQVIIHNNPCLLHAWGDIPDPSSCDHYLSCTNTRTIRRPCPASLYFRPTGLNSGYCDYRYNVDCIDGVRRADS